MKPWQQQFIELALKRKALGFGEFTLKSGRVSPYFFNAGKFQSGSDLDALGACYADAIINSGLEFDLLFGPAYKGIPLAAVTAAALYSRHGVDIPFAYNRKEAKDHGEGGNIVGAELKGRVMVIDDVITAGTAIREVCNIIQQHDAKVTSVMIGLDRQETGKGELSAIEELQQSMGLQIEAIIRLDDIINFMENQNENSQELSAIKSYRIQYGINR